jgi:hypothetical protein
MYYVIVPSSKRIKLYMLCSKIVSKRSYDSQKQLHIRLRKRKKCIINQRKSKKLTRYVEQKKNLHMLKSREKIDRYIKINK